MKNLARWESNLSRFKKVIPKPIDLSKFNPVKTAYLKSGETLPLLIQPRSDNVDLVAWTKLNLEFIERELLNHGALLFRDFYINSMSEFENFALTICADLFGEYGDLPRASVGANVYESTPYPADQAILFHNESSHLHCWPLKQWFFCVQPARQGGETPIVDCRKVCQLLDSTIIKRFKQKHIMYVRNFTDGLDVSWQNFFKTTNKSAVEEFCTNSAMYFKWLGHNRLRTRKVCPAVAKHPKTGDIVWFNQIQHWHLACLDQATRESLLTLFQEEDLPRNCYYGDGSPIENSIIEEINEVLRKTAVSFSWQQGDILMVDNMLTAHARNPYLGPRQIVVAMGEMIHKASIAL